MGKATKEQKAIIHILKKQYDISDDSYRELMFNNFNVFSSVDLTEEEAEKFIHILNMEYVTDYRNGYNHAMEFLKDFLVQDKAQLFNSVVKRKFNRNATDFELELFNTLDIEKQTKFIRNII